jgi:hypothetical protein
MHDNFSYRCTAATLLLVPSAGAKIDNLKNPRKSHYTLASDERNTRPACPASQPVSSVQPARPVVVALRPNLPFVNETISNNAGPISEPGRNKADDDDGRILRIRCG